MERKYESKTVLGERAGLCCAQVITWLIYGRYMIIIVGCIDCCDGLYKIYCNEFPPSLSLPHAGGH